MTDQRSDYDEDLPWLEAVDDEEEPRAFSARKMLAALAVVLLAALIVAATFFWLGRRDPVGLGGAPELIRAEPGPYKVRPPNPGGLDVAGESETAFKTSAGEDADAQLDVSKLPGGQAPAPAADKPAAAAEKPAPEPDKPDAAPTGASGSVIQLGAYKNAAQAERAWTALSSRFPEVARLNKMVVPFAGGMRLRAGASSSADARAACAALKAGGENCFVAN